MIGFVDPRVNPWFYQILEFCDQSMSDEKDSKNKEICFIGIGKTREGFLTFGSIDKEYTNRMSLELKDHLDRFIADIEIYRINSFPNESYEVPGFYVNSFKRPYDHSNWNLRQGFSDEGKISIVDWWSYLDSSIKREMSEKLFNEFRSSKEFEQINKKSDINKALKQFYPSIGDCGLNKILKNKIWNHIKREKSEQLSKNSKKALKNSKKGKSFEELFKKICDGSGLKCYKKSAKAFKQNLPEKYEKINQAKGNMKGIPDFFVDKGNTHSLNNWMTKKNQRKWEPKNRYAFVECKYKNSPLSKKQKEMISLLKKYKIEVYIFRGSEKNFEFKKYIT